MTETPGTHTLTTEQTEGMESVYGERYHHVQTGEHGPLMFEAGIGNLVPNNRANRRKLLKMRNKR